MIKEAKEKSDFFKNSWCLVLLTSLRPLLLLQHLLRPIYSFCPLFLLNFLTPEEAELLHPLELMTFKNFFTFRNCRIFFPLNPLTLSPAFQIFDPSLLLIFATLIHSCNCLCLLQISSLLCSVTPFLSFSTFLSFTPLIPFSNLPTIRKMEISLCRLILSFVLFLPFSLLRKVVKAKKRE